jgi:hypothetical protein
MGLSIHYKGQIINAPLLPKLIEEVTDIAKIEKWNYFVFEEKFPNNFLSHSIDDGNLYGIMISPPQCEPLCFSFLANGRMCGILNFNVLQLDPEINNDQLYLVTSKTQYAGFEIHKKIILLLEYIASKYLKKFECVDEGQFWETRNEKLLEETFEKYTVLISNFEDSFTLFPMLKEETLEAYCIRIAEITHKKENQKEK